MGARPERRSLVGPVLVSLGFVLFIGPGPLTVLVPWLLSGWELREPLLGWTWLRGLGVALLCIGIPVLVESIVRFVWKGRGTLTPAVPTQHLVVSGVYRFVRNPMYVGVVSIIVGEALLLGSGDVLIYAALSRSASISSSCCTRSRRCAGPTEPSTTSTARACAGGSPVSLLVASRPTGAHNGHDGAQDGRTSAARSSSTILWQ